MFSHQRSLAHILFDVLRVRFDFSVLSHCVHGAVSLLFDFVLYVRVLTLCRCAQFLAKNLPSHLLANELCFKDPATALTQTYLELDKLWLEEATKDCKKMEDGKGSFVDY